MNRKYYIRGLGFGILITTLVFSFFNMSEPSDEEVVKRAEELGYVLKSEVTPGLNLEELLADSGTPKPSERPGTTLTPEPSPEPTTEPSKEPTKALTPTPVPTEVPTLTPTEVPTPSPSPTYTPTPVPTEAPTTSPTPVVVRAEIHVVRGNSASQVCKMMQEAGIISDWEMFHGYLKENDLVDHINVGKFVISSDMSFKEIARVLTGK